MTLPWIWCFKAAHRLVQVRAGSGTVNQTKSRVAIAVGAIVMFAGGCGSSGVATASETAPTSQAELSWTTTDLGPAEFNAVACSTRISCVALGPYGWVAWSDDGGAKWTTGRVTTLDNSTINSVVCPSANRCVAIGVENETRFPSKYPSTGVVAVSSDEGRHWTRVIIKGSVDFSGGLACPTATVCYATTTTGSLLESSDGGITWPTYSAAPKYGMNNAISCPEVRSCWVTGGRYGLVSTTNGGRSWTQRHGPVGAGGNEGISGLYCPTMLRCIAVGTEPSPGYPVISLTGDGGSSWRFASFRSSSTLLEMVDGSGGLASVACSAAHYCVAVGTADTGWPIVVTSNDDGESWQTPTLRPLVSGGGLTDVACGALNGCVTVGSTRNDAAVIATSRPDQNWDVRLQAVGSNWSSLSCPGLGHCVAVGSYEAMAGFPKGAEVLTSADAGLRWVQRTVPAGVIALSGVDCPSVSRCYATAYVAAPPDLKNDVWMAALLRSDDGGRTWRRESIPSALLLAAISCPTASTCYAVGATYSDTSPNADAIVKTVDGGSHWLVQPVPTPAGADGLYGIACPSARLCWAVGESGALATLNGGGTWRHQPLGGGFQAIACPSEEMCVAVNNQWSAGSPIYFTLDGGRTWFARSSPAADPALTGVSCPTTSECVAVGSDTKGAVVLASFDGGRRWVAQDVPQTGVYQGYDTVACTAPRHCIALGGGPIAELVIGT